MAMALQTRDHSQFPCPSCEQGMGQLTGMRVEGALRVFSYTCATCNYQWQGSVRWLDAWWPGLSTEPQMIGKAAGPPKKSTP